MIKPLQGNTSGVYWFILQTHTAAKTAFRRYIKLLHQSPLMVHKNESEKFIQLINGSHVFFKSGHNFEDLRMETLDGCIIDEVRQQNPDLWPMVIRPMLSRKQGWCDFLSTGNGFDHFKDLYDFAKVNPQEWSCFHAASTSAPWWTEEEVASAKATMSDDVFAQEILAEFREIGVGKAYKNHGEHNQLLENPLAIRGYEWSPFLPLNIGLDFNVGLQVWTIAQTQGNRMYIGDEIAIENTDTEQCAKVLVNKILKFYAVIPGPKPPVILIGDASGNARRSSAVGETDYSIIKRILKENNIVYEDRTPKENPGVKDRVNMVNCMLRAADGSVSLFYHPLRCKYLKRDFERVKWKMGTDGAFLDKSDPLQTHSSDSAGYIICHYNHIFRERPGKMKVILR